MDALSVCHGVWRWGEVHIVRSPASEAWKRGTGSGAAVKSGGARACWRCGETGHIKAFCPRRDKSKDSGDGDGKQVALTTGTPRDLGTIEIGERMPGQVY